MNGYRDMWNSADRSCQLAKLGNIGTLGELGLITSEVAEAMEHVREPELEIEFGEELADVIIRTLNLMSRLGIQVESYIERKDMKNRTRGKLHGRAI
jgi:NTP pyrophosphatase (non-canonical NTP hydrolase)